MDENEIVFHLPSFYFQKEIKKLYKQQKNICAVCRDGVVAESTVCLKRLRNGNFDLKEREHSGSPTVVGDDQIEMLIKTNAGHTRRDIFHK